MAGRVPCSRSSPSTWPSAVSSPRTSRCSNHPSSEPRWPPGPARSPHSTDIHIFLIKNCVLPVCLLLRSPRRGRPIYSDTVFPAQQPYIPMQPHAAVQVITTHVVSSLALGGNMFPRKGRSPPPGADARGFAPPVPKAADDSPWAHVRLVV